MKNQISKLGKALNKAQQKEINGGIQDLCTICGYLIPNMMTCISPKGGRYNIPCIPE